MPDDVPLSLPPRPPAPQGAAAVLDRARAWRHDPRAGVAAVVICALLAGAFWFRSSLHSSANASVVSSPSTPRPSLPARTTTTTAAATVVVHVAGAVARPGVVTLRASDRVVDAIRRAGGAQPDADLDRLDLAAHVTDGTRIYVPRRGQAAPVVAPGTPDPSAADPAAPATPAGPIDLNSATEAQLETLPGIGPALAAAIIAERGQLGGFTSVDDLRRVRGIGDARFAQLQPLVTV